MKNLKDVILERLNIRNNVISERLVLTRRESFNHTFEDIWEMIYKMSNHEYYLEDDDEFYEDQESLPKVNNLPRHWKMYNGWSVIKIEAGGNRELCDNGPDHEDAVKILELELTNLQNPGKSGYVTIESDDEYYEILGDKAREILYIALKEQLS